MAALLPRCLSLPHLPPLPPAASPCLQARADMIDNGIVRAGAMRASQVHYVMRQLAAALAFLHSQGMVHRDVKVR